MNLINFFEKIPKNKNDIVFFDIDDTLLHPHTNEPIKPVLDFYNYLVKNRYNIAIITARIDTPTNLHYTIQDLKSVGIENNYNFLVLRPPEFHDVALFKRNARKQIIENGYTPLISIGDAKWDMGEYGGIGVLVLPDN